MNRSRTIRSRTGFTLIEMLIAVTLVLLMMVMFGEIFQIASNSVTKQRTMADNDQNARTFITVIRADLDKRSFRTVVPYFANEDSNNPGTPFGARGGYFYISNNYNGFSGTPSDGTDDVLQLTVTSASKVRNADETPYYGHAVSLPGNFYTNLNQPNWDDGQADPGNNAGSSRAAEVCYFVRSGRLYRRVMLLRDPITTADLAPDDPAQPTSSTGVFYFRPTGAFPASPYPPPANFWSDFDYSAHRLATGFVALPATAPYAIFNGVESLRNDLPLLAGSPAATSIAQSWNRFGHNHEILANDLSNGLPREFASTSSPPLFMGRFTHEETSNAAFQYPQRLPAMGNPMDASASTFADVNNDGVLDAFAGGPRTGVDLLLSHVHEFRVEVWDERLNDFAPIGHTRPTGGTPVTSGDYHIGRRLNSTYGPLGGPFNVFDTWHPNFNRNFNLNAGVPILGDEPDRPPYRPVTYDPAGIAGHNPNLTNPSGNGPYWAMNTNYQVGDVVFPQPGEDLNFNGYLDPGEDGVNGFPADGVLQDRTPGYATEDLNGNNMLDPGEDGFFGFPTDGILNPRRSLQSPYFPTGLTYVYRCIRGGTSGPTRMDEPNWSSTVGYIMRGNEDLNGNGVLDANEDTNSNGVLDTAPDWIVDYNVRPLRAIRITVRFEHPSARQMKQVTIVHSLRDTTAVP